MAKGNIPWDSRQSLSLLLQHRLPKRATPPPTPPPPSLSLSLIRSDMWGDRICLGWFLSGFAYGQYSYSFHTMDRISIKSAAQVLSIECLHGSSTADEWTGGLLQAGDVVEELTLGGSPSLKAPFRKGAAGVQKILRESYKRNETSVLVRVRRGSGESAELHACIVPDDSATLTMKMIKKKKQQYALRAIGDPNYTFGFRDRTENDCLRLQGPTVVRYIHSRVLGFDFSLISRWTRNSTLFSSYVPQLYSPFPLFLYHFSGNQRGIVYYISPTIKKKKPNRH